MEPKLEYSAALAHEPILNKSSSPKLKPHFISLKFFTSRSSWTTYQVLVSTNSWNNDYNWHILGGRGLSFSISWYPTST